MTRLWPNQPTPAQPDVCVVSGRLLKPDGQPVTGRVTFMPRTPGKVRDAAVVAQMVTVQAGPDGSVSVRLLPSAVLGPYTVRPPVGAPFVIQVPDAATALLADCIVG